MSFVDKLNTALRIAKTVLMLVLAVAICWRGTTFNDPVGTGVVPILMCLGAGVSLTLLAFSLQAESARGSSAV